MDVWGKNGLGASAKQRHAAKRPSGGRRRIDSRLLGQTRRGNGFRGKRQHCIELRPNPRQAPCCGAQHASGHREPQRGAKAAPRRNEAHEDGAHEAVGERTAVGFMDLNARMIDEATIIDARRTSRHAGEAAEAMVDRPDILGLDLAAGLEQVLDQIDAPARAVALVAPRRVGRAGRGAEAAMHT